MIRVAGVHDQVDARIDARGPDGLSPTEVLAGIHERVRDQDRRHAAPVLREWSSPALAEQGIRIVSCAESGASDEAIERHFREQIFPVLTPLARRRRPAVPLHLQPLAEPDRPPARPRRRPRGVRPRQGAQGGPAAIRGDREGHVHPARGHHRPPPRRAVPRDGDPQPRPVPRHARRRFRGLRRGRRPAPGGRGRAAPPPLRRGRAPRGRARHGARAADPADRVAQRRRGPGLRRRGPARPRRPLADRRDQGPPRHPLAQLDAGDRSPAWSPPRPTATPSPTCSR